MNVRGPKHAIYAMTFREAEGVASSLGWTDTQSWADGYYVQTRESKALLAALEPYLMAPGEWERFFPKLGEGVEERKVTEAAAGGV